MMPDPRPRRAAAAALAAACLFATPAAARAQTPGAETLETLLSGAATQPTALTLKEIEAATGKWKRVKITVEKKEGGAGGLFGSLMSLGMGGGGGGGDMAALGGQMEGLLAAMFTGTATAGPNVYYTQGKTVTIGSETYLVAYQPRMKDIDFAQLSKMKDLDKMPPPKPLGEETVVALSLINLRTVSTLTDIRPFALKEEVAASEEMIRSIAALNEKDNGGGGEDSATAAPADPETPSDPSSRNLKALGTAVLMYTQDYDEMLPPMDSAESAKAALSPYTANKDAFAHPETKEAYLPNPILSRKRFADVEPYGDFFVAFYEAQPAADGTRGVVTVNGRVKRIPESEWPGLKKASKIP